MKLLLDLGNSRLKWACAENNQLHCGESLSNSDITQQILYILWRDLEPQKVTISCVAKSELLHLITAVARKLWRDIPINCASAETRALGVKNGYLKPEKLGIDRWLALIATRQKTTKPTCVVDCGTAITVDVLNSNGEHQGGLICAGLTLMKNALALHTADLPLTTASHQVGLAIETEAAIYNGTLFAACGLIERVMQKQPQNTQLFLTGGDALIISTQLTCPFFLEPNLVLEGLFLI